MAETSVTDFITLPKFGQVSVSTNVWTGPCHKSGRVNRVEIDAYDNGHRLIWPTLYTQK